MKMNDNELKARLAEAEALFSRYRWEEAIASFEAILAARPDHAAASQGLADALEQQKTDLELAETIGGARQALAAHQFSDALAALNRAQTRGAMRHILKYHGEIDGLRSQAQEGRELKRMADQALERAEGLAGQRKMVRPWGRRVVVGRQDVEKGGVFWRETPDPQGRRKTLDAPCGVC